MQQKYTVHGIIPNIYSSYNGGRVGDIRFEFPNARLLSVMFTVLDFVQNEPHVLLYRQPLWSLGHADYTKAQIETWNSI